MLAIAGAARGPLERIQQVFVSLALPEIPPSSKVGFAPAARRMLRTFYVPSSKKFLSGPPFTGTFQVLLALLRLCGEPSRITGKQRAVRTFGLSVFPEMRLTVSFRITYTLRPVWDAEAVSEDFLLFFVPQRTSRPLSFKNISPPH